MIGCMLSQFFKYPYRRWMKREIWERLMGKRKEDWLIKKREIKRSWGRFLKIGSQGRAHKKKGLIREQAESNKVKRSTQRRTKKKKQRRRGASTRERGTRGKSVTWESLSGCVNVIWSICGLLCTWWNMMSIMMCCCVMFYFVDSWLCGSCCHLHLHVFTCASNLASK